METCGRDGWHGQETVPQQGATFLLALPAPSPDGDAEVRCLHARVASRLGSGLLAAGVVLAALAGLPGESFRAAPGILAVLLAGAILLYDGVLKGTWAGPVAMGTCRFLNVLLGLAAVPGALGW